jgi:hypothetical protein
MERFHGDKISYPVDIGASIHIMKHSSVAKSFIVSYSNLDHIQICNGRFLLITGILAINVKSNIHINAFKIDCENFIIERFEPYGSRLNKTKVDREVLIDSQLEKLVNKLFEQTKYKCKRFYTLHQLGPQSRDPKNSGYCYAWSILYLNRNHVLHLQMHSSTVDYEYIKKYSEYLYSTFPRHTRHVYPRVYRLLRLNFKRYKFRAHPMTK